MTCLGGETEQPGGVTGHCPVRMGTFLGSPHPVSALEGTLWECCALISTACLQLVVLT